MSFDREDIIRQATNLRDELKQVNDMLDEAAPLVLPEVARILQHCTPLADMISSYIMSPRFQAAVKVNATLQLINTLVAAGKSAEEARKEATEAVNATYESFKVF